MDGSDLFDGGKGQQQEMVGIIHIIPLGIIWELEFMTRNECKSLH